MIDVKKIFEELDVTDAFKKVQIADCPIGVYCGIRSNHMPSLAFMSRKPPLTIESTQYLQVSQWKEKENVYWSRFDLELMNAKTIFFALCVDLINVAGGSDSDENAMRAVRSRYMVWRKMFRKTQSNMTGETYKGLFGELFFIKSFLIPRIGINSAIRAWSGPDMAAKDFSYNEKWYEVKTISVNSTMVQISSLTQLDSKVTGHLCVIKLEQMSDEYDDGECTIAQLISELMTRIIDENIKDLFLRKLLAYGYDIEERDNTFHRYKVKSERMYLIDEGFPRITEKEVPYDEIVRVTYSLSLVGIQKFMEDADDIN